MSSINSVRNYEYSILVRKTKKLQNQKNDDKKWAGPASSKELERIC